MKATKKEVALWILLALAGAATGVLGALKAVDCNGVNDEKVDVPGVITGVVDEADTLLPEVEPVPEPLPEPEPAPEPAPADTDAGA